MRAAASCFLLYLGEGGDTGGENCKDELSDSVPASSSILYLQIDSSKFHPRGSVSLSLVGYVI
jgi:hypothetical protein